MANQPTPTGKPGFITVTIGFLLLPIIWGGSLVAAMLVYYWVGLLTKNSFLWMALAAIPTFFAAKAGIPRLIGIVLGQSMNLIANTIPGGMGATKQKKQLQAEHEAAEGFSLFVGTSTGDLAERGHAAGVPAAGVGLNLKLGDACQNFLILGATGSGKTTRYMLPMLNDILGQPCAAFIVDVKGDFGGSVHKLAARHSRKVTTIGVGGNARPINLISGLTPDVASSFVLAVIAQTGGKGNDAFWQDTAGAIIKNTLGILQYVPGRYSLAAVHDYLFPDPATPLLYEKIRQEAAENAAAAGEQRQFDYHMSYFSRVLPTQAEATRQGVMSTIDHLLNPFTGPALADAFSSDSPDNVKIEDILSNGGQIYLVDLPLDKFEKSARLVYVMLKLRLYNFMQGRTRNQELNQDLPVIMMIDEFQEMVTAGKLMSGGLSDASALDKLRSAKFCAILSSQSVAALQSAIGDETTTMGLLGNLRQKILLRPEDPKTLKLFQDLIGSAEVWRESLSENEGQTSASGLGKDTSNRGEGRNWSLQERKVIDAQYIRSRLDINSALVCLSANGKAVDDIVRTPNPLYL